MSNLALNLYESGSIFATSPTKHKDVHTLCGFDRVKKPNISFQERLNAIGELVMSLNDTNLNNDALKQKFSDIVEFLFSENDLLAKEFYKDVKHSAPIVFNSETSEHYAKLIKHKYNGYVAYRNKLRNVDGVELQRKIDNMKPALMKELDEKETEIRRAIAESKKRQSKLDGLIKRADALIRQYS